MNEIIKIETDLIDAAAGRRFRTLCGFNLSKPKSAAMMEDAAGVLNIIHPRINFSAAVKSYGRESISGDGYINLDSLVIKSDLFKRIPSDSVSVFYAYVATLGGQEPADDSVLSQFYADVWGTAYIEAGCEALRELLFRRENAHIQNTHAIWKSISPGFYGIPALEVKAIYHLLEAGTLGITLTDSGMMSPQKSCAGFYFIVDKKIPEPEGSCVHCKPTAMGCRFCDRFAGSFS